ncbi:uncharacterized protein PHACADRAFT_263967 [Phanerochaete carnosa HHB-10118-sp]|uniref:Uncharacterized protein n=1 Tax=Phanerochaete carnosa (strain HHB-10118-sp) TaxID=650164 RepID=K5ULP3_PHACS|nr:uncharacterized protein PHACADRAFT_263967 [Phanerochaete carnosa HHB-10118-sp]EKM50601.1 hypothetical protein PHACADRAFT_263967 [Phanerochaete carnosa HHB-10118-sp]
MRYQARRALRKGHAVFKQGSKQKEHRKFSLQTLVERDAVDQDEPFMEAPSAELGESSIDFAHSAAVTRITANSGYANTSGDSAEVAPRRTLPQPVRIVPLDEHNAYLDDRVIDISSMRELDLPPRYYSPLDAGFQFHRSSQRTPSRRPLPTPPEPTFSISKGAGPVA